MALRSIRVYVPSSDLWCETFSFHDSDPYISTLSTVATTSILLSGKCILYFHIMCILCSSFNARAFLTLMSFYDELIQEPRYFKPFSTYNV